MPAGARRLLLSACALAFVAVSLGGCTSAQSTDGDGTALPVSTSAVAGTTTATPTPSHSAAVSRTRQPTSRPSSPKRSTPHATPRPPVTPASQLPLRLPTGSATRVITVVAPSTSSTTATLQAWQRSGSGWIRFGPPAQAWLGADGLSSHPSESRSATPIGSFTLTQAFGHDPNPGTALPYRQTTPADWWISESGPLYNTLQRCSGSCPFRQGDPNEHLFYTTPFYNYAVVIDYNTANSPTGVVQGAGSAFFLHVAVGQPTAGCVAIPVSNLVSIMKWLTPAAHPRILIGVS